jgi:hypothetical protein
MSEEFHPVLQLRDLLGPKPNHPWGALLPQVLLWCFRRFCVEKLISASQLGSLAEQVWNDHFELVQKYAPKGLSSVSTDWFSPENIDHVTSPLEDWDRFFIDCLVSIDDALERDDEAAQDRLSEFLDEDIAVVVREWLDAEFRPFRIFPVTEAEDDVFTEGQCTALVQALMKYAYEHPVEEEVMDTRVTYEEEATEVAVEAVVAPAQPPPQSSAPAENIPPSAAPPAPAPLPSITSAIRHRRKTLCLRPRDRSTRGKTRKLEQRS